ncbi:MAG: RNA polymerase sigma factor [Candidatus Hydrogenedentes bacterium]|nr:RNA polymerase sigma factor [Candidatus Hydrogenedentota bacterium]
MEAQTPNKSVLEAIPATDGDAAPSDEEWVRRAQQGEQAAFDAIVRRYGNAIYRHLYRLMLNREDAEDVAQETFIRAFRYLDRLEDGQSLRAWLYTIATRVGLNAIRSQQRRGKGANVSYNALVETSGEIEEPSGRNAHRGTELRDEVSSVLATLPPRSALLMQLHYTEGFPIREAAEIVGMSTAAAKVALCRARKELRERLCEEDKP